MATSAVELNAWFQLGLRSMKAHTAREWAFDHRRHNLNSQWLEEGFETHIAADRKNRLTILYLVCRLRKEAVIARMVITHARDYDISHGGRIKAGFLEAPPQGYG